MIDLDVTEGKPKGWNCSFDLRNRPLDTRLHENRCLMDKQMVLRTTISYIRNICQCRHVHTPLFRNFKPLLNTTLHFNWSSYRTVKMPRLYYGNGDWFICCNTSKGNNRCLLRWKKISLILQLVVHVITCIYIYGGTDYTNFQNDQERIVRMFVTGVYVWITDTINTLEMN